MVQDPLAIDGIHHLEIYTESAKQTAYFLSHGFGFAPIAYKGLETGSRNVSSYILKQGKAVLIISSPLSSEHPINQSVLKHGTTVHDIAFEVPDCETFYKEAISKGARSIEKPTVLSDDQGQIKVASIATYGDTIHSIIERKNYKGNLLPGYAPYKEVFPDTQPVEETGLIFIDHVVGNVELGKMEEWVSFYEKTLGFSQFKHFSDKDISTEYSALMSKVMNGGGGKIKLPINEPAEGKRKSQIQEYLDFHNGPGVQHIALLTDDIVETVTKLRNRGVHFLKIPQTYYSELPNRIGKIEEDLKAIATLGILADRDEEGYLLQIFTKTLHDRPTLFFEVIQRRGSKGFGVGNFKALFEAIERDQAQRGNL